MAPAAQERGLFDEIDPVEVPAVDVAEIPGLQYVPNFIGQDTHDQLLEEVDAQSWLGDLKRRVQHYGYKYDYTARRIDSSMRIGSLPGWAMRIATQLAELGLVPELPDQMIVNEYEPGQGIASHVDCVPCFADTIVSLSLGSACVMNFKNKGTRKTVPLLLNPRSLVILRSDARYKWAHGIAARKTDNFQGRVIQRRRRVSLTFRKVVVEGERPKEKAPEVGP